MVKSKMDVHFSSEQEDWGTPRWLFRELDREFGFELDGAASDENALCEMYYTKEDNALLKDWGKRVVWLNPPYGRMLEPFMQKARRAAEGGATVVCLVPARTDTNWFHEYLYGYGEIRLIRGRLYFGGCENAAPFPSLVCILRPRRSEKLFGEVIVSGSMDLSLEAPKLSRRDDRVYGGDLRLGEGVSVDVVKKARGFGSKKKKGGEQIDLEEILR